MVVVLEDRQCQVPSQRASKWVNLLCFCIHGGLTERASKWEKYDYGVQLWNATISIEYEITNMVCHYAYGM